MNTSKNIKDESKVEDMPKNVSELMNKISNKQHNISVYLAPNWSIYNDDGSRQQFDINTRKYNVTPLSRGLLLPIYSTTPFQTITEEQSYNSISLLLDALTNVSPTTETDTLFKFLDKKMSKNFIVTQDNKTLHFNNSTNEIEINLTTYELQTQKYNEKHTGIITEFMNSVDTVTANTDSGLINSVISSFKESPNPASGKMVGHESWENIVQVAPVMAVLLNKAMPVNAVGIAEQNASGDLTESVTWSENVTDLTSQTHTGVRKKRFLNVVPIEMARPQNLTVRAKQVTTPDSLLYLSDMQEFAQMVELEDDDVDGHVLLRNMGRYLGPALFNACDYREAKARYVLLFNSSRIVIAISNFTMERMTLVLTTARTLINSEARCPRSHLECQVSGARVCIDSTSACDGVPNCGAYDIYDEDRLQCGGSAGLQHNVCLAAFTFLAALLTLLYTVHYWLKRCVPKVSSAFFIYTDGTENVLYLDSIMRSPNDLDDTSKIVYQGNAFEDEFNTYIHEDRKRGFFKKLSGKSMWESFFWKSKLQKQGTVFEVSHHTYSFTELELRKMRPIELVDQSIQTGESLEMAIVKQIKKNEPKPIEMIERKIYKSRHLPNPPKKNLLLPDKNETSIQKQSSHELEMLRFLKETKADSLEMRAKKSSVKSKSTGAGTDEETEIHNTEYETVNRHRKRARAESHKMIPVASRHEVSLQQPQSSGLAIKRLRFEEGATTIPDTDDEEVIESPLVKRRSVFLGSRRPWRGNHDMERAQADDGHSGAGKEFRRFWSNSKGNKKVKKRTDYTK